MDYIGNRMLLRGFQLQHGQIGKELCTLPQNTKSQGSRSVGQHLPWLCMPSVELGMQKG